MEQGWVKSSPRQKTHANRLVLDLDTDIDVLKESMGKTDMGMNLELRTTRICNFKSKRIKLHRSNGNRK